MWLSTRSRSCGYTAGHIDLRPGSSAPAPSGGAVSSGLVISATGTTISTSSSFSQGASTIVTGLGAQASPVSRRCPPRRGTRRLSAAAAVSPTGRCAAGNHSVSASRRSRVNARWRAAFGAGNRVDLVDDDGLDRRQYLSCPGGEHQIERLGRGDEYVGGMAQHCRTFCRWGVTGSHRRCVIAGGAMPSCSAARWIPASGARRLRSMS